MLPTVCRQEKIHHGSKSAGQPNPPAEGGAHADSPGPSGIVEHAGMVFPNVHCNFVPNNNTISGDMGICPMKLICSNVVLSGWDVIYNDC